MTFDTRPPPLRQATVARLPCRALSTESPLSGPEIL